MEKGRSGRGIRRNLLAPVGLAVLPCLMLMGACRRSMPDQSQTSAQDAEIVEGLCRALLDDDASVRYHATFALMVKKHPASVTALIPRLRDTDELVRETAATALGVIHDPDAWAQLAALIHDPSPMVRVGAIRVLSHYPDEAALPEVRKALLDDDSVEVRRAAARYLGVKKDAASADALMHAFGRDRKDDSYSKAMRQIFSKLRYSYEEWQEFLVAKRAGEVPPGADTEDDGR